MILNDLGLDSNIELLGNSAKTVEDYLSELYPDATGTYALEQLAAGDNGSSSLILTSGGTYQQDKNSIQSYDSYRDKELDLYVNPIGGKVNVNDFKPVKQIFGSCCIYDSTKFWLFYLYMYYKTIFIRWY